MRALLLAALLALRAVAAGACAGDCGIDGEVTVDELVVGVTIALGAAPADRCPAVDADGDAAVSISELIGAVNAALEGCPPAPPRLIALGRDGGIASLDRVAPWTVRATADLGATVGSARCRAGRCLVVHPSVDAISVVAAADLSPGVPIRLPRGADPRDVAFAGDDTAIVSQYGRPELLVIDLRTRTAEPIDLGPFADADGLPEALQLASCGRRVFAQLRRVDHDSEAPSALGAALAVIDLDRPAGERVVDADPLAPGLQGIALAGRPNFDMPVDCAARRLWVAEPKPLMQGGGGYEEVNLDALTAAELPIATSAEVGGFEVVGPGTYWLITHTEFGPGPSSHLSFIGATMPETYNTFAPEHVNDLALDRAANLLFFPDPCVPGPTFPGCAPGIHVFEADTGAPVQAGGIEVGFPPIEVTLSDAQ